jgi:hypothetical protein
MRKILMAIALSALPVSAMAEVRVTEGYVLDNMARQACQIGPDYNEMMATMSARMGFGLEAVDDPDVAVRMTHPDGIELVYIPDATDGAPTCIMTVPAALMTPELFDGYVAAAIQSVPDYSLGDPVATDAGQVWEFAANKDQFTGITWVTRLTQSPDGALTLEKRPTQEN